MNESINIENYEAFFLDYLEGRLSEEKEKELFFFLEAHPGLKAEMEGYEELHLSPAKEGFNHKDKLKQPVFSYETIDEENIEGACIAYWEGDLTTKERRRVEKYLTQHPERERDFSVYGKLFLKPGDQSFSGKKKLYRKSGPVVFGVAYRISAVAAVVLVILAFVFWQIFFSNPTIEKRQAAIHHEMVAPTLKKPENTGSSVENMQNKAMAGKVASSENHKNEQKRAEVIIRRRAKESAMALKPPEDIKTRSISRYLAYCPVTYQYKIQTSEINPQLAVSWHGGEEKAKENYLTLGEYASLKIKKDVIKEDTARTPRLSTLDIMLLGVKGINVVTGINLQVEKKEDPSKGKEYFAMTSNIFSYIREHKTKRK